MTFRDRVYKALRVLEIRNPSGRLNFRRWRLFESNLVRVFVHEIRVAAEDLHPHKHPWDYWSLMLTDGYTESVEGQVLHQPRWSLVRRDRKIYHRLLTLGGPKGDRPVYTLFFAFGEYTPWGYLTEDGFVEKTRYRLQKKEGRWKHLEPQGVDP